MGNSYFRFKQFTIEQDRCAMKVSTDACIQGAWTPATLGEIKVLDIGAGTGLLSLMLAQRSARAVIDAVELDEAAALQASENVASSPWRDRVKVINADAVTYNYEKKYDLVIANPPFFNNSLLGPDNTRNHARHTIGLTYQQLFEIIQRNTTENGLASVLLPAQNYGEWLNIMSSSNWYVQQRLLIHPSVNKPENRVVAICSKATREETTQHLHIREGSGSYTSQYKELMLPFYLDQ